MDKFEQNDVLIFSNDNFELKYRLGHFVAYICVGSDVT